MLGEEADKKYKKLTQTAAEEQDLNDSQLLLMHEIGIEPNDGLSTAFLQRNGEVKKEELNSFTDMFSVRDLLGFGSYGVVLQVKNRVTKEHSALKIISKEKLSQRSLKVLKNESTIMQTMNHPSVVALKRIFENKKFIILEMELIPGGQLKRLFKLKDQMENPKPLTDLEASQVMKSLLKGVAYVHARDIVHRDLKPENILLSTQDDICQAVKIVDFGLSAEQNYRFTQNERAGTLIYMAPEQATKKGYSKKVDLWACGIIAYQLLACGKHPCYEQGENYGMKLQNIEIKPIQWSFTDNFTPLAKDFFLKLCAYPPSLRYDAATALQHPWITRNSEDTIPKNVQQEFDTFKQEHQLRKVMRLLYFASHVKVHSLMSDKTQQTQIQDCENLPLQKQQNSITSKTQESETKQDPELGAQNVGIRVNYLPRNYKNNRLKTAKSEIYHNQQINGRNSSGIGSNFEAYKEFLLNQSQQKTQSSSNNQKIQKTNENVEESIQEKLEHNRFVFSERSYTIKQQSPTKRYKQRVIKQKAMAYESERYTAAKTGINFNPKQDSRIRDLSDFSHKLAQNQNQKSLDTSESQTTLIEQYQNQIKAQKKATILKTPLTVLKKVDSNSISPFNSVKATNGDIIQSRPGRSLYSIQSPHRLIVQDSKQDSIIENNNDMVQDIISSFSPKPKQKQLDINNKKHLPNGSENLTLIDPKQLDAQRQIKNMTCYPQQQREDFKGTPLVQKVITTQHTLEVSVEENQPEANISSVLKKLVSPRQRKLKNQSRDNGGLSTPTQNSAYTIMQKKPYNQFNEVAMINYNQSLQENYDIAIEPQELVKSNQAQPLSKDLNFLITQSAPKKGHRAATKLPSKLKSSKGFENQDLVDVVKDSSLYKENRYKSQLKKQQVVKRRNQQQRDSEFYIGAGQSSKTYYADSSGKNTIFEVPKKGSRAESTKIDWFSLIEAEKTVGGSKVLKDYFHKGSPKFKHKEEKHQQSSANSSKLNAEYFTKQSQPMMKNMALLSPGAHLSNHLAFGHHYNNQIPASSKSHQSKQSSVVSTHINYSYNTPKYQPQQSQTQNNSQQQTRKIGSQAGVRKQNYKNLSSKKNIIQAAMKGYTTATPGIPSQSSKDNTPKRPIDSKVNRKKQTSSRKLLEPIQVKTNQTQSKPSSIMQFTSEQETDASANNTALNAISKMISFQNMEEDNSRIDQKYETTYAFYDQGQETMKQKQTSMAAKSAALTSQRLAVQNYYKQQKNQNMNKVIIKSSSQESMPIQQNLTLATNQSANLEMNQRKLSRDSYGQNSQKQQELQVFDHKKLSVPNQKEQKSKKAKQQTTTAQALIDLSSNSASYNKVKDPGPLAHSASRNLVHYKVVIKHNGNSPSNQNNLKAQKQSQKELKNNIQRQQEKQQKTKDVTATRYVNINPPPGAYSAIQRRNHVNIFEQRLATHTQIQKKIPPARKRSSGGDILGVKGVQLTVGGASQTTTLDRNN